MRPATAKRLSWRRRARIVKSSEGARRFNQMHAVHGRTFSLSKSAKCTLPNDELPKQPKCRLELWLRKIDAATAQLRDTRARWSQSEAARGKYGESLVHVLIVAHHATHSSAVHVQRRPRKSPHISHTATMQPDESAHLLLLVCVLYMWPRLVCDAFASDRFRGLNCAHLCVAHANEPLLGYLVRIAASLGDECRAQFVEQRATGSLYRCPLEMVALQASGRARVQPALSGEFWCDKQPHWPTADGHAHLLLASEQVQKQMHQAPDASDAQNQQQHTVYLGASPLAWTVSFNSRLMYELLATHGRANQDACDAQLNTCLHQLVINNQTGWTRYLVKMGADDMLRNGLNMTPLQFTCHLGRVELFSELLELSAAEFWSYSMVRCCGYPLAQLDSIADEADNDATTTTTTTTQRPKSALELVLESHETDNEQKARLLSSAVVKKLLEEKWRIFARRLFYRELARALCHLLMLSVCISLRPARILQATSLQQQRAVSSERHKIKERRLTAIRFRLRAAEATRHI